MTQHSVADPEVVTSSADGSAARGPVGRLVASGFGRIAGISASLVATQALTSVLGLAFWTVAARQFIAADVGVAGAAVALMMLLGALGTLGLGTVLIARLPGAAAADRRVLVRTSLTAALVCGGVLGLTVPAAAVHLFGARGLAPVAGSWWPLLGLAVGTGLTSVVMVLDQAVLTIGHGTLQLERNVTASAVKLVTLLALGFAGLQGGMTIFLAWTIGNLLSLPLVSWRSRGGRAAGAHRRLVEPSSLRGFGRLAASHHALNVSIQAALQLLPVLVTVLVSAAANSRFNAAIMVAGFVFALPYAVSVGLFAAARGDEAEVVRRMRLTIPFGLAVSVAADIVIIPLAGPVLHLFGARYAADGTVLLQLIVLAGLPFVLKDHFIALRRVQGRTTQALVVTGVFLVAEIAAAAAGARLGGTVGLCIAWLAVLVVEAVLLAVPLIRAVRAAAPAPTEPLMTTTPLSPPAEESDLLVDDRPAVGHRTTTRSWSARNLAGPLLTTMAVGVLVLAVAAALGRAGAQGWGVQTLWYAGLVVIVLPAALRIVAAATPHSERMIAVVGLAVTLQLSRLVLNPTMFSFHDEFIHETTLRHIIESGRLFGTNTLLPVSAYYPGLEIVTDAVRTATGLPLYPSAVIVLVAARLVLVLAIIGVIGSIGASRRAGAVGALVYLANPQQLFFNSQFSYQTLALPLAVLCCFWFVTRRPDGRLRLLLPLAATAAVVLTHHLTAALLLGGYLVWIVATFLRSRPVRTGEAPADASIRARRDRIDLAVLTVWGAALLAGTAAIPGNPVGSYLAAIFDSSSTQLLDLGTGGRAKTLFADSAGTGPTVPEQALLIASVLLSVASLVVVLGLVRRSWRHARPLGVALGAIGLLYPLIPGGHLTSATAEVGDRASGFVFLGIGAALGTWWWLRRRSARAAVAFGVAITVTFLGSVVLGSGPASGQLPGPYQIAADARSVDADNLAAARWQDVALPGGSTVYGDRVSGLLAGAIGDQRTLMHVSTGVDLSRLLLAPGYTAADRALIDRVGLEYLIVDTRLSEGLPHQQFYIESGEYGGQGRTRPVDAAALAKFDAVPGVDRVYDDGGIVIYDLRGLR